MINNPPLYDAGSKASLLNDLNEATWRMSIKSQDQLTRQGQSRGLSWILIVQFSFICYVLYGARRCGMLANKINLRYRQNGEIRHRGTDVYYN